MKLYFYCAFRNFKGRKSRLKSIDNQKVFYIRSEDLYAAVSYTKYNEFSVTGENIKVHEHVIEEISRKTDIVPFPFNTIAGETIGKGVLNRNYGKLMKILDRIGGKDEFIITAEGKAGKNFKKLFNIKSGQRPGKTLTNDKLMALGTQKLIARLQSELIKESFDSSFTIMEKSDRFFEGRYLVSKEKTGKFKKSVTWLKSLFPEIKITVKGPFPPYDFNPVNIGSEKSQMYGKKFI
ncbi:MAG: hypothetical protein GY863_17875 [bacterium]|nr:hypothetical protein [bacterium]